MLKPEKYIIHTNKMYSTLFIYFWLCWGFDAVEGFLSSCSSGASDCGGSSCCRAHDLGPAGFGSCSTWAQQLWHMDLGAQQQVESSQRKTQTHVLCTSRRILNHWTASKVLYCVFSSSLGPKPQFQATLM